MKNKKVIELLIKELNLDRNVVKPYIDRLTTISRRLHSLYINQCNGIHSDEYRAYVDDKSLSLEKEAKTLAKKLNVNLYLNTDPRGYPIGIIIPGSYGNTLGGDWRLEI